MKKIIFFLNKLTFIVIIVTSIPLFLFSMLYALVVFLSIFFGWEDSLMRDLEYIWIGLLAPIGFHLRMIEVEKEIFDEDRLERKYGTKFELDIRMMIFGIIMLVYGLFLISRPAPIPVIYGGILIYNVITSIGFLLIPSSLTKSKNE